MNSLSSLTTPEKPLSSLTTPEKIYRTIPFLAFLLGIILAILTS